MTEVVPALSVVMPVRNGVPELARQLEAISRETVVGGFEVVVSDNGSTDGTRALAESFGELMEVRVVEARRPGVACARNVGVLASRADKVLFLDHDDEIEPGYLQAMADALDHDQLVASRIDAEALNPGGAQRELPQVTGLGVGWRPWGYGASIGMSRDMYLQVGGCDEELDYASDDIDLCWRLQMAGATMAWVPDAVLHYQLRSDLRVVFRQGRFYGRGGAQIVSRFEPYGLPVRPLRSDLRMLAGLLFRCVADLSSSHRARSCFLIGRRLGVVEGRLRHYTCRPVGPDGRLAGSDDRGA